MKFIKRLCCITMVALLVINVGCSNRMEPEPVAEQVGRFVETEITPPALNSTQGSRIQLLGIFPQSDALLDAFFLITRSGSDPSLAHYHSTDNGGTWVQMPVDWYTNLFNQLSINRFNIIMALTMDNDGTLYCVVRNQTQQLRMYKITNGQPIELVIPDWYNDEFYTNLQRAQTQSFAILSNNDIVISFGRFSEYGYVYDGQSGKQKHKFATDDFPVLFQDNQMINIAYDQTEKKHYLSTCGYDGRNSSNLVPVNYEKQKNYLICEDGEQGYFLLSSFGVDHIVQNGSILETIMDGDSYQFGRPSVSVTTFKYNKNNENLYLYLMDPDTGGQHIYRYHFDAKQIVKSTQELTVFSLTNSDTLQQAIALFQISHPGQTIRLQTGLQEGTAVTKEDVIRQLNTELLAKRGPDIIILDGLPINAYISKGVLLDLSSLANSNKLFTNITTSYAKDGVVSALPTRYVVPLMVGEQKLVDELSSLHKIAEQALISPPLPPDYNPLDTTPLVDEKRPLFYLHSALDPIRLFFNTYSYDILNTKNQWNSEALSEFLTSTKTLYEAYGRGMEVGAAENMDEQILSFDPKNALAETTRIGISNAHGFSPFVIWSDSSPLANGEFFTSPDLYFQPLCGSTTNVFIPSIIAGINISSKNQESAKQFVETLLSKEVQRPDYREGFPVNKEAFAEGHSETIEKGLVSYAVDVEAMFSTLKTPVTVDEIILGAILDEAKPYYTGEESIESAVQNIIKKTQTYLTEKS